jgi:hypothetical protein
VVQRDRGENKGTISATMELWFRGGAMVVAGRQGQTGRINDVRASLRLNELKILVVSISHH